jgi:flavin reductase (DIM6/NTAB) family NADH-FMN oxidoreductase RutF
METTVKMEDAMPSSPSGARHAFVPGPGRERAFRTALGQFPTGVTIVTTQTPQGVVGITANSFSSLSLDPPLVLWSPARASRRYGLFATAPRFSIHILSDQQAELCTHFTRDGAPPAPGTLAAPLEDALVRLDCTFHASHEGGDHTIIVGRVEAIEMREGAPLLFHAGQLARLAQG